VIAGVSPDLPHLDHLPPIQEWGLQVARPLVAAVLKAWWEVHVHHPERVPLRGPVILAANHIGFLDGPALVAFTRRRTFALAKQELFTGPLGVFLSTVGQISLDRFQLDKHAINRAIQVLRAQKVLAVFPEGVRGSGEVRHARRGAAYLAMVTGASVVPVALLGTRKAGQTKDQLPPRGSPIHIVYGEPFSVPPSPWPRRKAEVGEWTGVIRRKLADHVVGAQEMVGLPLPGPPRRLIPRP
jgi:1-acyl-sn-glycerol-3-phosphate acyltransferase